MQVLTPHQSNALILLRRILYNLKTGTTLKKFCNGRRRHDIILQYKTLPNYMLFFNLRSHRLKMALHFPRPVSPTAAGFLRNLLLGTVKCSSFLQLQPCLVC